MLDSEERGKPEYPEKTSRIKDQLNNQLNPHMTPSPGIEHGPHGWEASALTTAPSLLSSILPWLAQYAVICPLAWLSSIEVRYFQQSLLLRPPSRFTTLCDWLAKLAPVSQPIKNKITRAFSRAWRHIFASNSDWFIALLVSVVTGDSNSLLAFVHVFY